MFENPLFTLIIIAMQLPVVLGLTIISKQAALALRAPSFNWISIGWLSNFLYLLVDFLPSIPAELLSSASNGDVAKEALVLTSSVLFWIAARKYSQGYLWPPFNIGPKYILTLATGVFFWKFFFLSHLKPSFLAKLICEFPSVAFDIIALVALLLHLTDLSRDTLEHSRLLRLGLIIYILIQPIALGSGPIYKPESEVWYKFGYFLGLSAKYVMLFGLITILFFAAKESAHAQAVAKTKSRIFHELGTPIPLLELQLHQLEKTAPKGFRSAIREARETATRANALLSATGEAEQILLTASLNYAELAMMNEDPQKPESINTLIELAWLSLKKTRKGEEVHMDCSYSGNCCVLLEKTAGVQIFVNLLRNCYDAFPNGEGSISISTENLDSIPKQYNSVARGTLGWVKITITDDGEGIIQDPIDDILIDGNSTRGTPEEGRGLGLGITRRIIAKYHGEIFFRSPIKQSPDSPGRYGTEVTLIFPRERCKSMETTG